MNSSIVSNALRIQPICFGRAARQTIANITAAANRIKIQSRQTFGHWRTVCESIYNSFCVRNADIVEARKWRHWHRNRVTQIIRFDVLLCFAQCTHTRNETTLRLWQCERAKWVRQSVRRHVRDTSSTKDGRMCRDRKFNTVRLIVSLESWLAPRSIQDEQSRGETSKRWMFIVVHARLGVHFLSTHWLCQRCKIFSISSAEAEKAFDEMKENGNSINNGGWWCTHAVVIPHAKRIYTQTTINPQRCVGVLCRRYWKMLLRKHWNIEQRCTSICIFQHLSKWKMNFDSDECGKTLRPEHYFSSYFFPTKDICISPKHCVFVCRAFARLRFTAAVMMSVDIV